MSEAAATPEHTLSPARQKIGVVIWVSFLVACVATLIFFAYFDPLLLGDDLQPPRWLATRMSGYGIGFFFFWIISAVAATLAVNMLVAPLKQSATKK